MYRLWLYYHLIVFELSDFVSFKWLQERREMLSTAVVSLREILLLLLMDDFVVITLLHVCRRWTWFRAAQNGPVLSEVPLSAGYWHLLKCANVASFGSCSYVDSLMGLCHSRLAFNSRKTSEIDPWSLEKSSSLVDFGAKLTDVGKRAACIWYRTGK